MDYFDILLAKKLNGGGGGDITIEDLYVNENGTVIAPSGKAYGKVVTNVPAPSNAIYKHTLTGLPSPIATFTGADAPIDSLKASIVAVQSGSGDPSPSNIRPISGWTGCEINKWGFNWWDEQWEVGKYDTDTGEKTPVATRIRSKGKIPMLPETDYYTTKTIVPLYYDEQGNYLKTVSGTSISSGTIFTTPSGIAFMSFHSTTSYGSTYNNDICINLSKTTGSPKNGDYVAYSGNTYTIPFKDSSDNPITVYGGVIDVTGGKLTITHSNIASYNGENINEPWISSEDAYTQGATPTTGAQVVYPLTTPLVYDFDPLALRCNGVTNISVNCGAVTELKYYSETP